MNVNVQVKNSSDAIHDEEIKKYIDRGYDKYGDSLESIDIEVDGENVQLTYHISTTRPFERIRRITGYLVGTLDKWNNAKRAEEHDRVKHVTDDGKAL